MTLKVVAPGRQGQGSALNFGYLFPTASFSKLKKWKMVFSRYFHPKTSAKR